MKKPKTIDVEWIDAGSNGEKSGWVALKRLPYPITMMTRGFVVKETKTYLVVAGTVPTSKAGKVVGEVICIPKVAIIRRWG